MAIAGGNGAAAARARSTEALLPVRGDTLAKWSECMQWVWDNWRVQRAEEHAWEIETLSSKYAGGDPHDPAVYFHCVMFPTTVFQDLRTLDSELHRLESGGRGLPLLGRGGDVGERVTAGVPARRLLYAHLSLDQVARMRALLADANARIWRLADVQNELARGWEAGEDWALQVPSLLRLLRRMQRLTDDVFVPLRPLMSIIDDLNLRFDGRRRKSKMVGLELHLLGRPTSPLQRSTSI